ncbi:methyl-accepting chemotaxis protein, partial [candidate division CSSED10-310 bacterium]
MTAKNLKIKYHMSELWALYGLFIILYFIYLHARLSSIAIEKIVPLVLLAIIGGFGSTLFRNWYLFQSVRLTLAWDTFQGDITEEALLTARGRIFELPLKRAFWMFERFLASGIIGLIFLFYYHDLKISTLVLIILIIVVAGAASSILTFYTVERIIRVIHFKLHGHIEHKNVVIRRGKGITVAQRQYAALFILVVLIMLQFGTYPLYLVEQWSQNEYVASGLYVNYAVHVLVMIVNIMIFTLSLGYFMSHSISASVNALSSSLSRAEYGDLATRTPVISSDEIGNLSDRFNNMMRALSEIFGKVRSVSDSVTLVAERLSSSSVAMSEGVELQATSTDTTASSMEQMQSSISEVADSINNLFREAEKTSHSIVEMASSIEEVADNIESLSHSVDTTSTSIEEMNISIKQVAENSVVLNRSALDTYRSTEEIIRIINEVEQWAIESSKLSTDVTLDAEKGHNAVQKTIEGMEKIHQFFQTSGDVIQSLSNRSEQIGNILVVIDDVSSQTNLLALNAAIISAQAGEHGKEFSVVADEIRDLAEKATASTQEIAHLIKNVQSEAAKAVQI